MRLLSSDINLDQFYQNIKNSQRRLLMLDYDGTLSPLVEKRDEAVPYPGVTEALTEILHAGRTRLVIVTGRAVRDLDPLLPVIPQPEVWGNHGWERRLVDGAYILPNIPGEAQQALESAKHWAIRQGFGKGGAHGERLEVKPASIAFHWRGCSAEQAAGFRTMVFNAWKPLEHQGGLQLKEFNGGLELGLAGRTKGDVVQSVLGESDGAVAFLGDDRTDEDAFDALAGRGLRVLVAPRERVVVDQDEQLRVLPGNRATAADVWIEPPLELLEFLYKWV